MEPTNNWTESISLIIEWENVLLSQTHNSRKMLYRVIDEILSMNFILQPEVMILFDPEDIQKDSLISFIQNAHPEYEKINLKVISVSGLKYFEMKNYGAAVAVWRYPRFFRL